MTNGGLGVALYWPSSLERIYLPFRLIEVSPIGISSFFSGWWFRVIASELVWMLLPALMVGTIGAVMIIRVICKTSPRTKIDEDNR